MRKVYNTIKCKKIIYSMRSRMTVGLAKAVIQDAKLKEIQNSLL